MARVREPGKLPRGFRARIELFQRRNEEFQRWNSGFHVEDGRPRPERTGPPSERAVPSLERAFLTAEPPDPSLDRPDSVVRDLSRRGTPRSSVRTPCSGSGTVPFRRPAARGSVDSVSQGAPRAFHGREGSPLPHGRAGAGVKGGGPPVGPLRSTTPAGRAPPRSSRTGSRARCRTACAGGCPPPSCPCRARRSRRRGTPSRSRPAVA